MTVKRNSSISWLYGPVMVVLLVVAAFLVGRLSAQVEQLKNGEVVSDKQQPAGNGGTEIATGSNGQETAAILSIVGLKQTAKDLKLREKEFVSCLDESKYAKKVKNDLAYGQSLGIRGTPTFFINGIKLVGAQPQVSFEQVIDAELKDGSGNKVLGAGTGDTGAVRTEIKYDVGYVRGKAGATVKIVEFSDFECPFCKQAAPTVEAILKKYGGKVSLEYRHFPLAFHAKAQKAAEAAECAGEQGKFWEFHDVIFGIQNREG